MKILGFHRLEILADSTAKHRPLLKKLTQHRPEIYQEEEDRLFLAQPGFTSHIDWLPAKELGQAQKGTNAFSGWTLMLSQVIYDQLIEGINAHPSAKLDLNLAYDIYLLRSQTPEAQSIQLSSIHLTVDYAEALISFLCDLLDLSYQQEDAKTTAIKVGNCQQLYIHQRGDTQQAVLGNGQMTCLELAVANQTHLAQVESRMVQKQIRYQQESNQFGQKRLSFLLGHFHFRILALDE